LALSYPTRLVMASTRHDPAFLPVMARLDRANAHTIVLMLVARSSRAMTGQKTTATRLPPGRGETRLLIPGPGAGEN
jgi:hypothetical protein